MVFFNCRMEDHRDVLTFKEITDKLLSKKNSSIRDGSNYISDLHEFVYIDISIIKTINNPKMSTRCQMIKSYLLHLLKNYDNLKKGIVNVKPK